MQNDKMVYLRRFWVKAPHHSEKRFRRKLLPPLYRSTRLFRRVASHRLKSPPRFFSLLDQGSTALLMLYYTLVLILSLAATITFAFTALSLSIIYKSLRLTRRFFSCGLHCTAKSRYQHCCMWGA